MVYAAILAGGRGERMQNTDCPKQFLLLEDKPILIHTVTRFVESGQIDALVVAVPHAWAAHTEQLLQSCFPEQRCYVVAGGEDRTASLLNVCAFLRDQFELTEEDVLVSHDAVRPFVTDRIIEENIRFAKQIGAANTVIPAVDTIAVSADGELLDSIPPRDRLYQVQTPQTFRMLEFIRTCGELTPQERETLTDASKIYLLKGMPVRMVMGEPFNIKLTTPHDLTVARFLVKTLHF